ncbi:MAG: hypothetical protein A2Z72_06145 [Omnitrophica bacterium RBG_13_46_9]|nr:MAG: hypothetical protein A2Z72_06145 [Omnitrophica bacterium RBG_13_46_9]
MRIKTLLVFILVLSLAGCTLTGVDKKAAGEEKKIFGFMEGYNPLVKEAQNNLAKSGIYPGPIDGKMGWQTREAVRNFQKENTLKATGFIDSMTWEKLNVYKQAKPIDASNTDLKKEPSEKTSSARVRKKEPREYAKEYNFTSKKKIKEIQMALKKAGFDPGSIDGRMGPRTGDAIKRFQKSKGMTEDGLVDQKTWLELSIYLTKVQD